MPLTVPENSIASVGAELHTVWLVTTDTAGMGFTVRVKLWELPLHISACGVTVIIDDITSVPLFVAVKVAIGPIPVAGKPTLVLLFVQLYDVEKPLTGVPLKEIIDVVALSHIV